MSLPCLAFDISRDINDSYAWIFPFFVQVLGYYKILSLNIMVPHTLNMVHNSNKLRICCIRDFLKDDTQPEATKHY